MHIKQTKKPHINSLYISFFKYKFEITLLFLNIHLFQITLPGLLNFKKRFLPMWLVIQVQRPGLVHLFQLLPVPEVQSEVRGDDGFADDLKHLLVFAGAQGGEDVVPFQLGGDTSRHTWAQMPTHAPTASAGPRLAAQAVLGNSRWLLFRTRTGSACGAGDPGMILWRRKWHLTPVNLPARIPRTEEPDGLQSMGSQRVRYNWATNTFRTPLGGIKG